MFEDDAARDKARTRLLRAAKKYGIVPIGFVSAELQPQRKLPSGLVTLLMTDVEGSTALLRQLDDRYPPLLAQIRRIQRSAVKRAGGREVDARADEFFAAFESAAAALEAAVSIQRSLADAGLAGRCQRPASHRPAPWAAEADRGRVRRVGGQRRRPRLRCGARRSDPRLVEGARGRLEDARRGMTLTPLGRFELRGFPEGEVLFQVAADTV